MKSAEFAYWLQGFFELSDSKTLNEKQVEVIKNHLNLVFYHEIDPQYGYNMTEKQEAQKIHDGIPPTHETHPDLQKYIPNQVYKPTETKIALPGTTLLRC